MADITATSNGHGRSHNAIIFGIITDNSIIGKCIGYNWVLAMFIKQ